jgi:hypothetical protein
MRPALVRNPLMRPVQVPVLSQLTHLAQVLALALARSLPVNLVQVLARSPVTVQAPAHSLPMTRVAEAAGNKGLMNCKRFTHCPEAVRKPLFFTF